MLCMARIPADSGSNIRSDGDKSLELLVIAFIVTGSIAVSVIVLAYATAGSHSSDGTGTMPSAVTESEPTEKIEQAGGEPFDNEDSEKPAYDFTEYIDRLLSKLEVDEKSTVAQSK